MDSTGPSSNDIDDEIDANIMLKKNAAHNKLPNGIVWNILGTVINNNDGPPVGLNPNAKTAGIIINAANIAEIVSKIAVLTAHSVISNSFPA